MALSQRWQRLGPAAHPALALAVAPALRRIASDAAAAAMLETALASISEEPSWTRLRILRALGRKTEAANVAAQLPELRHASD